jgi:acetyl esterase/lipase
MLRLGAIGLGVVVLALLALAACSPLRTFNALVPKETSVSIAQGIAYGPDPRQRLDVYAPPGRADAKRAVIVFFYGGSWSSGVREGYAFVGRALAAAGFVVVIPDYRLVPAVRFPGFLEDGAAAVRWARGHVAEHGGDGDRIVLAGHSAGAYNAAMLAVDPRWLGRDREAVRGLIGLAGPYDFYPFDGPVTVAAFGQWPRPLETQPITYGDAGDPPALLATADDDSTVRPRNSDALAAKLRAAGVRVERRNYAGIGHIGIVTALAKPFRGRAPVLADMVAFAKSVTAE